MNHVKCSSSDVTEEGQVVAHLEEQTLVGLLNSQPSIHVFKYQVSAATLNWVTSYLYGSVFTNSDWLWEGNESSIVLFRIATRTF